MTNWVRRRDLSDGAGGATGCLAVLLLVPVMLAAGSWWWLAGTPIVGEPTCGWARAGTVAGRASILAAVWWWAYQPGWTGDVGAVGVIVVALAGGIAWARRR